ncbi:MAG: outer membrane protein assembly factor BamD [Candidatus Omnitrophica bacterium]|nr:outer membrane protein assembly factor BamD [Candidatus Omnitrophota bacterium]
MKCVKTISRNIMVGLIFLIVLTSIVRADDAALYKEGLDYLKKGQSDFALLRFYRVVQGSPKSEYAEKAQFKVIEYFYQSGQSLELAQEAKKYYDLFPQGENINNVKKMIEENEVRVLRKNGEDAFNKGDWKSCIESFKAV